MSTVTLNSHAYPWANWTPTGLSRFFFAGSVVAGSSNLTFGNRVTDKVNAGQAVLSIPEISDGTTACGCAGSILRTHYTTVRREMAPNATVTEAEEALARLKSLVLTTQFHDWYVYGTLPT